ncbi:Ent-kaurene oxidase-like protein [Hapsidospora chrysogenum ATCC 11550]|uniref:Ent-kaurene oxidase-like protein n=1 Tax=Hapsidospora chrysogenum (strain ATCC 11550 / CBS 779.69 / DSM 880 / IAM 14645 / JCM 23072 / IMI 49137) TaxID=857340 RepID=A0A086SZN7_HAPC1|nr:Ent-kaurene oxidase-like protein [Hapsidospora chrysogenum ATCC 11550]
MDLPVNDSLTAAEAVVTSRGAIRQVLTHASALRLEDLKLNIGTGPTILVMIAAWFLLSAYTRPSIRIAGAPVVGRRSKWEPDLSLLWRYTAQAREIIGGGAARFKDRPFIVKRHDVDWNVMPHKYLDELRLVSPLKLSSVKANTQNLGHKWTKLTHVTTSNLHFRVVSNKLTPDLPKYLEGIRRELDDVWADEVPRPTEWQEFDIQEAHRRLAGRLAAKVFVGHPACRDPEWIRVSVGFSMDVFKTGLLLRMFPPLLHPIVARLLPSRRAVLNDLEIAKRTLGPLMDKHREHVAAKARGEEVEEEEDILLHWMMDHATDEENKLDNMAVRNLFITLAAVHTTSMSATHMLFDLCAHPEWLDVMRDEISQVKRELGPLGSSPEAAPKHWLARLEKMDSLFVESQRMNLPSLFVPQRIATEDYTLKDGTVIPKGAKITWAARDHMHDPDVYHDPSVFDPMRSYRKRHSAPGLLNKHLASAASLDSLAFGYGAQACPGRWFSVGEVKLILVKLLSEYEVKFTPDRTTRPENLYAGENSFPDPSVNIMLKLREEPL